MEETATMAASKVEFKADGQDIGLILSRQRNRCGLSQSDIAKKLGYANVNFISMIESGKSKIPINRVDELVAAYQLAPEFILVILRTIYPDFLETIYKVARKVPKIVKDAFKNPDEELSLIYSGTKASLGMR